jgi:hypothetical protein
MKIFPKEQFLVFQAVNKKRVESNGVREQPKTVTSTKEIQIKIICITSFVEIDN